MNRTYNPKIITKLYNIVIKQLMYKHNLVLAYSGGLDSTVLLDVLTLIRQKSFYNNGLDINFRAIHIHHGLNRNASDWANHCLHECQHRNVMLNIIHVKIKTFIGGIESASRNVRYNTLKENLMKNEILLTGHHQNDQAETFLLALKRGSGPTGLSSMASESSFYNYNFLIRPLLACERSMLKEYANQRKLNWIEDCSNNNIHYDRNFLRICILPSLCKRWPHFIKSVSRSAKLCAEQELLIDKLLSVTLNTLVNQDGSLYILGLTKLSEIERLAILRRWLAMHQINMPTLRQLKCIWHEIICSKSDSVAQLRLDNWQIRRFRNRLYIIPLYLKIADVDRKIEWPSNVNYLVLPIGLGILFRRLLYNSSNISKEYPKLNIPILSKKINVMGNKNYHQINKILPICINNNLYNLTSKNDTSVKHIIFYVRAPLLHEKVSIRFGSVTGLLYINGRCHARKLKKIWQELNIPPWQRKLIPLLFYNDILIAALGIFTTRDARLYNNQLQWQITWCNRHIF